MISLKHIALSASIVGKIAMAMADSKITVGEAIGLVKSVVSESGMDVPVVKSREKAELFAEALRDLADNMEILFEDHDATLIELLDSVHDVFEVYEVVNYPLIEEQP